MPNPVASLSWALDPRYRATKRTPADSSPRYILDLETTGLLTRYRQRYARKGIGIAEFTLRQEGQPGTSRFSNLLLDPLEKYDAEKDPKAYAKRLKRFGPHGTRWDPGWKDPDNVLGQVHKRQVEATREAMAAVKAGKANPLASEKDLVEEVIKHFREGKKLSGWNLQFDLQVLAQAAARSGRSTSRRFAQALNIARNRGNIEELSSGFQNFLFLGAQESARKGAGHEFLILSQLRGDLVDQARRGKLSVKDIEKLSWDKLTEPHAGFKKFLASRVGRRPVTLRAYERLMNRARGGRPGVQGFGMGQLFPDIRYTKGWSADILARTLAPQGLSDSVLGRRVEEILKSRALIQHTTSTDTAVEEVLEGIFRTKAKTWSGAWDDISPRLKEYGIETQEEFFNRWRSGVEWKGQSQLTEHVRENVRRRDTRWMTVIGEKAAANAAAAAPISTAAGSQPWTLKKIYTEAWSEVKQGWKDFSKKSPKLALAAKIFAGLTIASALLPERERPIQGIRRQYGSDYNKQEGIHAGDQSRGVMKALTDFGSGRSLSNSTSRDYEKLMLARSAAALRRPKFGNIPWSDLEEGARQWAEAKALGGPDAITRKDYELVKGGETNIGGVNADPWYGLINLKNFNVKVEDADTIQIKRRGLLNMFRKPVSVRLAGIDAPEAEHGGILGRTEAQPFEGYARRTLEQLIESQQSMRLLIDPAHTTYGRNVGVLVGDHGANLNLEMVKAGAAMALMSGSDKRTMVYNNIFAEAESVAARSGMGMWQSKGWQAHRAMGQVAGEVVTNTTLNKLKEVASNPVLSEWWGTVQALHETSGTPWTMDEMISMYQTGTAYRAQVMKKMNQGGGGTGPGIRDPYKSRSTAGRGIAPSGLAGANVSDFGSGRAQISKYQLAQMAKYMARLGGRGRVIDSQVGGEISDVIAAGRAGVAKDVSEAVKPVHTARQVDTYIRKVDRANRTWALEMGDTRKGLNRDTAYAAAVRRDLAEMQAASRTSSAQRSLAPRHRAIKARTRRMPPVPVGGIKDVDRDAPSFFGPSMKAQSRTHLNLPTPFPDQRLAIGSWTNTQAKELRTALTMSRSGARGRNQDEWMGMKSTKDFPASYATGAWDDFAQAGAPQAQAQISGSEKVASFGLLGILAGQAGINKLMGEQQEIGLKPAWDYFYNTTVKDKKLRVKRALQADARIRKRLNKMGFSKAEVARWRAERDLPHHFGKSEKAAGFWSKTWNAISDWSDPAAKVKAAQAVLDPSKFKNSIMDWFKDFDSRFQAHRRGRKVQAYEDMTAAERKSLKVARSYSQLAMEYQSGKYLWKNLVSDAQGFQAKLGGAWQMFKGTGYFTEMKLSRQAKLIGGMPEDLRIKTNIFEKAGAWAEKLGRVKVQPGSIMGRRAADVTRMGKRISGFGRSTVGRILGKVPGINVAFGLLEGITGRDQYENATKGFVTEAAGGFVSNSIMMSSFMPIVRTALMAGRAGWWAGGAVGSAILPGVGTLLGAVLGAAVAGLATFGLGMYLSGKVEDAASGATRGVVGGLIGARKRRTPEPYSSGEIYSSPVDGWSVMKVNGPMGMRFHAVDPSRPDMVPFGGPYNLVAAARINLHTFVAASGKSASLAAPKGPRKSSFAPTFGLVNNVLWNHRSESTVRSFTTRKGAARRPVMDRNRSRVLARAA